MKKGKRATDLYIQTNIRIDRKKERKKEKRERKSERERERERVIKSDKCVCTLSKALNNISKTFFYVKKKRRVLFS